MRVIIGIVIMIALALVDYSAFCGGPVGPYTGPQLSQQAGQAAAIDMQRRALELNHQRQQAIRSAQQAYQNAIADAQYQYQQAQLSGTRTQQSVQQAAQAYQGAVQSAAKTYQDAVVRAQQMR